MNRIKELRKKKHLTLKDMGSKLNMLDSTLSQYENEKRTPNEATWQVLANFFNVSVPYLQGIDEEVYDLKFPTKQEAIDFIHKIMKAQNIKLEDIQWNAELERRN